MNKLFTKAWLLCGTLDALYATILTVLRGGDAAKVWLGVAAGPFGDGANAWGAPGILAGLVVHFAIMAAMVAAFLFAYPRVRQLRDTNPWIIGTLYGLLLYGVMNHLVLAIRWPDLYPPTDPMVIARLLFPHIFFVGIPLALMARRGSGAARP